MKTLAFALLLALVLLLAFTLPARLIAGWVDLPPTVSQVQGSWWSGQARWQQPEQPPMEIQWRWRLSHWHWQANDEVSRLSGRFQPGRTQRLEAVQGELSLQRLDLAAWLPGVRADGRLALDLDQVDWSQDTLTGLSGRMIWEQAALSGLVETDLGRIALNFPAEAQPLRADIRSLEPAPITVAGELLLEGEVYRLDVRLVPDPARADLARQLEYLAEPDGDGQFHLRLSGRLFTPTSGGNP
ncbi:MAG: type II secretion system protein N [Wenzhouxiangella sp.]